MWVFVHLCIVCPKPKSKWNITIKQQGRVGKQLIKNHTSEKRIQKKQLCAINSNRAMCRKKEIILQQYTHSNKKVTIPKWRLSKRMCKISPMWVIVWLWCEKCTITPAKCSKFVLIREAKVHHNKKKPNIRDLSAQIQFQIEKRTNCWKITFVVRPQLCAIKKPQFVIHPKHPSEAKRKVALNEAAN